MKVAFASWLTMWVSAASAIRRLVTTKEISSMQLASSLSSVAQNDKAGFPSDPDVPKERFP
jgi:hypothetical protein